MPRWAIIVTFASTVLIALVLGVLWYVIGGWPRDHARYGKVEIPGKETLRLPDGEVRLSFEGQVSGGGETRTLEDPPPGLRVSIRSGSGRRLAIESVSSSLYSIASGDSGHEPYGKVDVPEQGRYEVKTAAAGGTGSGRITFGPPLWNPGDSRVLGALGVFFAALIVLLLLEAPLLLIGRTRRQS